MAGTTLGNAYVQIIPSAKGIKGSIESELSGEAQSAGSSAGSKIASFAKTAIIAAGVGKVFSAALQEGAALQQSLGGIETLFKDSADTMKGYASEAFKNAGLSANEYMETATGFAASLVSSLGGDTAQAAEIANMAIIDMSDNANKMGTDMESIQNAYQGFAKQNYTMLDNLKLGYGGTQAEMQRLLDDAEKISGVHYDISNLSDVYSAIHVIQGELGITGTTAEEASQTLSGSFGMMKSSAMDFLGALTGEGTTSVDVAIQNLADSAMTFMDNLFPMLENILSGLITALPDIIERLFDMLFTYIIPAIGNLVLKLIPALVEAVQKLADKIIEFANDPAAIESAVQFMVNFGLGIIQSIPDILLAVGKLILAILQAIFTLGPELLKAGWDAIVQFAEGIWNGAKDKIKGVIDKVKEFFDFDIHWPNIPLPHFSISPSGWGLHDLLESGTIPSLGISWYAKGGIFNSPSIIGVGERGPEAVIPINKLKEYTSSNASEIAYAVKQGIRESADVIGEAMAEAIEGMGIKCDSRQFGRVIRKVVTV